jgi:hypothetical protein
MKGSTRAATALAVGYLLGRRRKLRTAATMAAATAVGGPTVGGLVMRQGMKMLGSDKALGKAAPQLNDIVDAVRGDLLPAGKAALGAAATNRVDALTDSLHERAERVRNPASAMAEGAEGAARGAGQAASAAGKRGASTAKGTARRTAGRRERDGEYEDEDYEPEEPEYDEAEDDVDDEHPEDAEDAEDDDERREAAGRGGRTGNGRGRKAATTRRSPVTRTGR